MAEFDIRIGTLLDTSKAEAQLQEFINKYNNRDDLDLTLDIKNEGDLTTLEKSLQTIIKFAKSLENIKINVDTSDLSRAETNIGDTIKKNVEELGDAAQNISKEVDKSVEDTTKDLEERINKVKKKLGSMLDELQQMKLDPNANINEINKLQNRIKELGNIDFGNIDLTKFNAVEKDINSIVKEMNSLNDITKKINLSNIFQDTKVTPLLKQLEAVKEVMNFKGLDTSGIDGLINKLKNISLYGDDLKKSNSAIKEIAKDFKNLQDALKLKDIKSPETAIKKLLEYKNQLMDEIRLEVDTSKIEKAELQIKQIDEAIERLRINADESLVKNLIDINELKNIENMENASEKLKESVEKIGNAFDKLKLNTEKLKSNEFVDLDSLTNLETMIKGIEKTMNSLDFKNLNITQITELKQDLETLEDSIKNVENSAKNTKLDFEFNTDLDKITNQLNGLHSALIKMGSDSSISTSKLKEELEDIVKLSKTDLSRAVVELSTFGDKLKNLGKDFDLGNISGDMSQFTKYVNDLLKLYKQLSTTKDINFAKTIKSEIDNTIKAIDKLKDGFNDIEREFAQGFMDNAIKGLSQKFTQEIEKINNEADKLTVALYKISSMNMSTNIAEGLTQEFNKAAEKVEKLQDALRNALNSSNFESTAIINLRQELERAKESVQELAKKKIELDVQEAISRVEKLRNEVEGLDDVLNKLGGTNALSKINDDFQNGAISFEKATASLKKFENAMDNVGKSSKTVTKSFDIFDNLGKGIEGTFSTIWDSFTTFGIGELVEEGIENAVYAIKDTIVELDAAMTELKRVAPESVKFDDAGYKQIANDAREIGLSVGQSTEDVIKGMSTALQAGATSMQQASAIAQSSALLQNVSDMSADKASQAIASLVNQYYSMGTALSATQDKIKNAPKDYNNLTNAIDMINYAGNNFAISTEGVTDALQNGGAVLSTYGVTLSDSIAMISGANESLQDPSRIGNGLRSLAINFAGLKTNAKDGTIEMNKTAKALKEVAGIDIFTDSSKTSVKDMMTLMDEINGKWDTLNERQQLGLSEAIAGKTQAAVFQSLMTGWERVNQFRKEYSEGLMVGSAEKENLAYLDSIQGKWNVLKESMKSLVTNNVTQSFVKGLLDGATKVVQVIEKIMNSLGKLGTGGALLGIMTLIKGLANFSNFDGLTGLAKGLSSIFNTTTSFLSSGSGPISGIKMMWTGLQSLTTSAGAAKLGMIAFNAALNAISWVAIVAGIVMAAKAIDEYVVTTKEAIQASKEKQQSARDEIQSLTSQKNSLSQIAKEYDTLAKKTNKTAEEMDRFRELKQQIAEISPELVVGYDSNNDPILKLNGSLSSYIGELDVAIEKQRQLFLEGQAEEADARLKDNEKKSTKTDRNVAHAGAYDVINNGVESLLDAKKMNWWWGEAVANEAKTAKQMAEIRQKYRNDQAKKEKEILTSLSKERTKINENDVAIQSKYISEFLENSGNKLTENGKSIFSGFMEDLNWGTLNADQADELSYGLEKLAQKTAFTKSEMKGFESQIAAAEQQFKKTNAINAYGKALQDVAKESGQFDLQSWSGYMDEVNKRFENGALSVDQYKYSMGILAETISEISGIDQGIVLESLIQTGDVESALKTATNGLNNFMSAYGKSVNDLKNGDSMAIQLEKQYKAIDKLGKEMETRAIEGKFTAKWVLDESQNMDLPKQMRDIMQAFARDGEVTEIEQKVLMNLQAEIQDKGKISDKVAREIEDLLNGNFDNLTVDGKIQFNGLELTVEQAEALKESLEGAGITAESIKMGDTGIEDALRVTEQYKEELEKINDIDVRTAIDSNGLINTGKEVNNVVKALESIPKEQKTDFIADTARYFDGANSVEEAINKMPDIIKLKYNIGVEGNAELEGMQKKIEALPEQVRTEVYAETYSLAEVDKLTSIVEEFGETNATAILTLDGAAEVMHSATTTKDLLQGFQNVVYNSTLETEVKDELLKQLETKLNELDGKTTETEVEVKEKGGQETKETIKEVKEEAKSASEEKVEIDVDVKNEQYKRKMEEMEKEYNKERKIEVETEAKTEQFERKMEQVQSEFEEYNGSTASGNVSVNGAEESKEKVDSTNESLDEFAESKATATLNADTSTANSNIETSQALKDTFTQDAEGNITMNVIGSEKVSAAINEKGQLEQNGQAVTDITLNGSEKIPVAINEKGQLEVNGVARTDIDISGAEQLQFAINEKGQLEVNGQAVTDIVVNNEGKLTEAANKVESLPDEKSVSVSFDVNDALDSILSRLGLSNKKETITITVTCKDDASSTLDKINGYSDKNIKVSITCTDNASSIVNNLANKQIPSKQFSITANGSAATTTVNNLANKKISNKQFSIVCQDSASSKVNAVAGKKISNKTFSVICKDSATAVLSRVGSRKISNKTFNIDCKDNASSKISSVQSKKISNKSFTVGCTDNASSKLSSISSKLGGIRSKTVTVTVRYSQVGSPPKATKQDVSQPQVIDNETPVIVNNTANVSAVASTKNNIANVRDAMASVQASYTDTINTGYSWVDSSIKYDIDLLQDYNSQLERLENNLNLVAKQAENAFGNAKATLLEKQNNLLHQQQSMLSHESKELQAIQSNLRELLRNQGFSIDSNGAVTNYASKILQLEKAVESAKKAQDAYEGEDKNRQKSLQNTYNNANEKLQKAKETLSEYYNISEKVGSTKNEWQDVADEIKKVADEINRAKIEQSIFIKELNTQKLENQYDAIEDKIKLINSKMETTNDLEKISLLQQQYNLLDKQQQKLEQVSNSYKSQLDYYKNFLANKGFTFDVDGNADANRLNVLKQSVNDYESIKEVYDKYTELLRDTIPDLESEWWDLENQQNDVKESIKEVKDEMQELAKLKTFDFIDELREQQEELERQLDKLDNKLEITYGGNKERLLREQIGVINQQLESLEQVNEALKTKRGYMQTDLSQLGFKFDNNKVINADYILELAKTKDEYDELKSKLEEYYDIQDELSDGEVQWLEYKNQIEETKNEIENLKYELKEMLDEANITDLTNELKVLENQFDKLDTMKDLNSKDSLSIFEQQLDIIEQQKKATKDLMDYQIKRSKELSTDLSSYGFKISDNGTIENTAERLEILKDLLSDDEFSRVEGFLEDYFKTTLEEIPELEKQLLEHQVKYEDITKSKLEITKKIEDEITKVYEKQIEDRIKKIEEERDTQVESLNKQKEAYKKWRDEVDYNEDYDEQLTKVQELQNQIDIAKRDDSLSGKKRLEDLMKQLKEEQESLEELVQDKIDSDIDNMIDEEIDRVETNADKQIEDLEKVFSETKIAEMVANAIQTGLFTDIEGNVTELDVALMDFANNSVEYMGVLGESLKTELLDNLNIAVETMKELEKINAQLGNNSYEMKFNASLDTTSGIISSDLAKLQSVNNSITLGDMSITIQGDATKETVEDIRGLLEEYSEKIKHEIMVNVK